MRILIYNWVQFDNPRMMGGGVSLYLNNVIRELLSREGIEVFFLSSGENYGLFRRRPRIVETSHSYASKRLRTFSLINSPVKAPAHDAYYAMDTWLNDRKSVDLVRQFCRDHGPFDAFHIHNLEGIGQGVLGLTKGAEIRRIFYTLHNYMPVCPQIELLYDNRIPCLDFAGGRRCVGCIGHENRMSDLIAFQRLGSFIRGRGLTGHPLGNFIFGMLGGARMAYSATRSLAADTIRGLRRGFGDWRLRRGESFAKLVDWGTVSATDGPEVIDAGLDDTAARPFLEWRERNGASFRANLDGVFAVSDLARDTALRFLPADVRVDTLTLPIDIALEAETLKSLRDKRAGVTGISFIGYDIPSKGLPFLIDALAGINDPHYRENVELYIVARLGRQRRRQLTQLTGKFRKVLVVPGYERRQLAALSRKLDLNIVPSIWWETFNQVTVELGRLGVPSLVSDNVGAKQVLTDPKLFVFKAGDAGDLLQKLDVLVKKPDMRAQFFDAELNMPTVAAHVDRLIEHYSGQARDTIQA